MDNPKYKKWCTENSFSPSPAQNTQNSAGNAVPFDSASGGTGGVVGGQPASTGGISGSNQMPVDSGSMVAESDSGISGLNTGSDGGETSQPPEVFDAGIDGSTPTLKAMAQDWDSNIMDLLLLLYLAPKQ